MKRKPIFLMPVIFSLIANMLSAQGTVPNKEERIYALSHIWKEMQYNFVFPETLRKVNIDSLYVAYLPKVENVKNNYEYYRVLSEFMAHFNDGHTYIWTDKRPDEIPPLKTINFGEKIVVSDIAKNMADKIPVGSEIIKVNNIPAVEFVKDSVYSRISAGNEHWKFDKSVHEMLYGAPQSTVKITVKTPAGKITEAEMIRGAKEIMTDTVPFSPISIKILDENIGYIHLASCLPQYIDEIDSVFVDHIPQLRNCRGLIIDIRGNRGGSSRAWMMVAACLTESINLKGKSFSRKYVPVYKMWGEYLPEYKNYSLGTEMEEICYTPITTNIPDSLQLHQPLMIISGPFVASASEFFLSLMQEMGRATIVGEPSVGCLTEPMLTPLPGGFEARISVNKYTNPDGTQSNDTGILPDIEVKRSYEAYLKGKDNVLERAIEELRKAK